MKAGLQQIKQEKQSVKSGAHSPRAFGSAHGDPHVKAGDHGGLAALLDNAPAQHSRPGYRDASSQVATTSVVFPPATPERRVTPARRGRRNRHSPLREEAGARSPLRQPRCEGPAAVGRGRSRFRPTHRALCYCCCSRLPTAFTLSLTSMCKTILSLRIASNSEGFSVAWSGIQDFLCL